MPQQIFPPLAYEHKCPTASPSSLKVYLHRKAVDFRKSINGLTTLVEQAMGHDPFSGAAYAFRNRRCDRIKLLTYDRTGFWLLMKRLEQDRFVWPRRTQALPDTGLPEAASTIPQQRGRKPLPADLPRKRKNWPIVDQRSLMLRP